MVINDNSIYCLINSPVNRCRILSTQYQWYGGCQMWIEWPSASSYFVFKRLLWMLRFETAGRGRNTREGFHYYLQKPLFRDLENYRDFQGRELKVSVVLFVFLWVRVKWELRVKSFILCLFSWFRALCMYFVSSSSLMFVVFCFLIFTCLFLFLVFFSAYSLFSIFFFIYNLLFTSSLFSIFIIIVASSSSSSSHLHHHYFILLDVTRGQLALVRPATGPGWRTVARLRDRREHHQHPEPSAKFHVGLNTLVAHVWQHWSPLNTKFPASKSSCSPRMATLVTPPSPSRYEHKSNKSA